MNGSGDRSEKPLCDDWQLPFIFAVGRSVICRALGFNSSCGLSVQVVAPEPQIRGVSSNACPGRVTGDGRLGI